MAGQKSHKMLEKIRRKLRLNKLHPVPRMIVIGVVGGICFIVGIVMIFTPGPALLLIPLGLLLLATEFKWAERWANKVQGALHKARVKWRAWRRRRAHAKS